MKTVLYNLYNLIIIYSNNFGNIKRYCKLGLYIVYYKYINQNVRKDIDKFLFLIFIYLFIYY